MGYTFPVVALYLSGEEDKTPLGLVSCVQTKPCMTHSHALRNVLSHCYSWSPMYSNSTNPFPPNTSQQARWMGWIPYGNMGNKNPKDDVLNGEHDDEQVDFGHVCWFDAYVLDGKAPGLVPSLPRWRDVTSTVGCPWGDVTTAGMALDSASAGPLGGYGMGQKFHLQRGCLGSQWCSGSKKETVKKNNGFIS